jgi:hypothetical protein
MTGNEKQSGGADDAGIYVPMLSDFVDLIQREYGGENLTVTATPPYPVTDIGKDATDDAVDSAVDEVLNYQRGLGQLRSRLSLAPAPEEQGRRARRRGVPLYQSVAIAWRGLPAERLKALWEAEKDALGRLAEMHAITEQALRVREALDAAGIAPAVSPHPEPEILSARLTYRRERTLPPAVYDEIDAALKRQVDLWHTEYRRGDGEPSK